MYCVLQRLLHYFGLWKRGRGCCAGQVGKSISTPLNVDNQQFYLLKLRNKERKGPDESILVVLISTTSPPPTPIASYIINHHPKKNEE